jgi:hypothetical protein
MPNLSLEQFINCQDITSLEHVIETHADEWNTWTNSGYADLVRIKTPLRQFVSIKGSMLAGLDFNSPTNRAFIVTLHDVCCALFLSAPATILYNIIVENELLLGARLEAAMMVLRSYGSNDAFAETFVPLCKKLKHAIQNEEDEEWPCISVFIRYYAKIVRDLPHVYTSFIRNQVNLYAGTFPFLRSAPINEALSIDLSDTVQAYQQIIEILLGTHDTIVPTIEEQHPDVATSRDEYAERLATCGRHFSEIRSVANNLVEEVVEDQNAVFNTLGRGVRVLTNEEQLLVYLRAYGPMHEAKLNSAFDNFPFEEIDGDINVVDWGCGQALATMILIERLQAQHQNIRIKNVLLIEPSSVALNRAELHVRHFDSSIRITTINKGFDAITPMDLSISTDTPIIHLFSNILDYEGYDLSHLENLVETKFTKRNYFVCSSPYINETKAARLYSFEQTFSRKNNYTHYYGIDSIAGTWQRDWTRVIRVFAYGDQAVQSITTPPEVFISYSTKDYLDENNHIIPGNIITKIQEQLTAAGITYWIDREGLVGGDHFPERIAQRIHDSKVLLFVSTENSNQSNWTANEIATAHHYGKTIIPFKVDSSTYSPAVMIYIAMNQYIPYQNNPNAMQQIVDAIRSTL